MPSFRKYSLRCNRCKAISVITAKDHPEKDSICICGSTNFEELKFPSSFFDCDNEIDWEYCESFSFGRGCCERHRCSTYDALKSGKPIPTS